MREKQFLEALGMIDDKYINEAMKKKKKNWKPLILIAASFFLCIMIYGRQRGQSGMLLRELVASRDGAYTYFVANDKLLMYEVENETITTLANFSGTFYKTNESSKIYYIRNSNEAVYEIVEDNITQIGKMKKNGTLIDIIDNKMYSYHDKNEIYQVYETDCNTDKTILLFEKEQIKKPSDIKDNKIYYITQENEIQYFDMKTKDVVVLNRSFVGEQFNIEESIFYDDVILLKVSEKDKKTSFYKVKYDGSEAVFLTEHTNNLGVLDRFENTLYYVTTYQEGNDFPRDYFVYCDFETGEILERRIHNIGQTIKISVCEEGVYYIMPHYDEIRYFEFGIKKDSCIYQLEKTWLQKIWRKIAA